LALRRGGQPGHGAAEQVLSQMTGIEHIYSVAWAGI
jgi:hypothetical protein